MRRMGRRGRNATPSGRGWRMDPEKGICAPARGARTGVSGAQGSARDNAKRGREFAGGDLLAVLVLRLKDLDPATLCGDEKALSADFGHLADLALDGAEFAKQMLAAIKNLQLLAP